MYPDKLHQRPWKQEVLTSIDANGKHVMHLAICYDENAEMISGYQMLSVLEFIVRAVNSNTVQEEGKNSSIVGRHSGTV